MSDDLIEKGWTTLAQACLARAEQSKIDGCRMFFFAGAQHCLSVLLENDNIDDDDLIDTLVAELESYRNWVKGVANGGENG